MSEKWVMQYKCEKCGMESINPELFRRTIGNVCIPSQGGLLGGNIFRGDIEPAERKRSIFHDESDDKTMRIYGMDHCIDCFRKITKV